MQAASPTNDATTQNQFSHSNSSNSHTHSVKAVSDKQKKILDNKYPQAAAFEQSGQKDVDAIQDHT